MATASTVATSVDVLSPEERKVIVNALDLKSAALSRAARAATNSVVADAYRKEADDVQRLVLKFS